MYCNLLFLKQGRDLFFCVAGFILLCFLLAGCTLSLGKDRVSLNRLDSCPEWTLAQLEDNSPLFDDTTDTFTLECALALLRREKGEKIHRASAGAHVCFLLADRTGKDQAKREGYASEGVRWAEKALEEGGDKEGDIYYYLAVNLGIAIQKHPVLALKNLGRLESSLEKALELSPDVNFGGPYRVLGMLYLMAPPWPQGIGDGDRALELLKEATERFPEYPKNHIFYAQAIWEVEGEDGKAEVTRQLEEALRLMGQERWKGVRDRWMDDLRRVAEEANVELPGY